MNLMEEMRIKIYHDVLMAYVEKHDIITASKFAVKAVKMFNKTFATKKEQEQKTLITDWLVQNKNKDCSFRLKNILLNLTSYNIVSKKREKVLYIEDVSQKIWKENHGAGTRMWIEFLDLLEQKTLLTDTGSFFNK